MSRVFHEVVTNVEEMIEAVRAAGSEYAVSQAEFSGRLAALVKGHEVADDLVDGSS